MTVTSLVLYNSAEMIACNGGGVASSYSARTHLAPVCKHEYAVYVGFSLSAAAVILLEFYGLTVRRPLLGISRNH